MTRATENDSSSSKLPGDWFGVRAGRYDGTESYWRQSLFGHRRFRWNFVTLVLVNAYAVFLLIRFWSRFSTWVVFWVVIGLVAAIRLFWVVYRSHESMRLLMADGKLDIVKGSTSDITLKMMAAISNWALTLGLSAVVAFLLALFGELIRH